MKKSTKKTANLLATIMYLAHVVNTETENHVFVNFYGHVKQLDMRVYFGGWSAQYDAGFSASVYIRDKHGLDNMIKELRRILDLDSKLN